MAFDSIRQDLQVLARDIVDSQGEERYEAMLTGAIRITGLRLVEGALIGTLDNAWSELPHEQKQEILALAKLLYT